MVKEWHQCAVPRRDGIGADGLSSSQTLPGVDGRGRGEEGCARLKDTSTVGGTTTTLYQLS